MAFNFHEQKKQVHQKEIQVKDPSIELTKTEIELILRLLGEAMFPVKDIEVLYITLYKLQEQHKFQVNASKG